MTETIWQTSLIAQGAVSVNGAVMHFGNPADELASTANKSILCDMSHLGLLELSGADARSFLQGQVTNDVNLLTGHQAHYSGYCTPKGRMLALFLAFAHHDHLHLQLHRELLESVMKRLKMYVMRAKVTIKDASDPIIKLGVHGPDVTQILTSLFTRVPSQDYELVNLENGAIVKLPSLTGNARFEIFTDANYAPNLWGALKQHCQPVGKPCWDWLEIQAGIPDVTARTQEKFVPQMLNLDILNGINFKKGCYTGQDIVARSHYLGSVKRRTYLVNIR
ncbi:MAG: CAF17-like 4Fe-4S cluster assembly/insertion protein YgfZ, partial [Methylophilaceae bacterium]